MNATLFLNIAIFLYSELSDKLVMVNISIISSTIYQENWNLWKCLAR